MYNSEGKTFVNKTILKTVLFSTLLAFIQENAHSQNWLTTGNAGTSGTVNFLGTTDNAPLKFNTNNVPRMTISSGGKVGIGTQAPTNKLTVYGGSGNSNDTALSVIYGLVKKTGNYNIIGVEGVSQPAVNYGIGVGGTGGNIGVSGTGGNTGVRGTGSTGVLGTGGTGVRGTGSGSGSIGVLGTGGTGVAGIGNNHGVHGAGTTAGVRAEGDVYGVYATSSLTGVFAWALGLSGTEDITGVTGMAEFGSTCVGVFADAQSGVENIGVYTQSANITANDYGLTCIGDAIASAYFLASDRKLKDNIQRVSGALDKIQQLTGSTYSFKQIPGKVLPPGNHIGFMADEVEKVFPELIKHGSLPAGATKDEKDRITYHSIPDVKVVNYMGLIPVLAEAIKEQKAIVDAKDARIAALETDLSIIKARLTSLENIASAKLSSVSSTESFLEQNNPNPFSQSTEIRFRVPQNYSSAQIIITSVDGKSVKSYSINGTGKGSITISANELSAGTYYYSLSVDGNLINTKSLVLTK